MDLSEFLLWLLAIGMALIVWLCPGIFFATILGFEAWSAGYIAMVIGWLPIGAVALLLAYLGFGLAMMLFRGLCRAIGGLFRE